MFRPENFRVIDDGDLARRIRLVSFGFGRPGGAFAEGHVAGMDAPGWLHLVDTQGSGDFIAKGFTARRPWTRAASAFSGWRWRLPTRGSRLAFLQSTRNIWRACPALARPYRGLRAFEEEDAPFFFGRDAFVTRMLEKAAVHPMLGVTAASGSGKSSAIRAGLLPKIWPADCGTQGRCRHAGAACSSCAPERSLEATREGAGPSRRARSRHSRRR